MFTKGMYYLYRKCDFEMDVAVQVTTSYNDQICNKIITHFKNHMLLNQF